MNKIWLILLIAITMMAAGCAGDDTGTMTYTDDDVEITVTTPEDAENEWCPVGTTWQASNPQTGESMDMEIVGTEVINGVTLCKAVVEIEPVTEDIAKIEYLWSEEAEMVIWTSYDASDNVKSEMTIIDGVMTITDENGQVMTFDMNEQ
ncbi:hypothetical protein [Methanococcoides orientis]|uniref:hypothetical protein n=1 Tax=Methanococcoides orientis TaxID=2822137 RepID=UPI001E424CAE|nr:hypothetical protein [Methanococcoides orientis]